MSEEWLLFLWEAMKPMIAEAFAKEAKRYWIKNIQPKLDEDFKKAIKRVKEKGE